jgi:hypothetical protein
VSKRRSIGSLFGGVFADGSAHVGEELFVVPRLLDEVRRARAHGIDHVADSAVRGNQDDRHLRHQRLDARQQVDTALAGQSEVQQKQVVGVACKLIETGVAVAHHVYVKAFKGEQGLQRIPDLGLIVNDQNALAAG